MRTINLHSHEYRKQALGARPQDNPVAICVGLIVSVGILAYIFSVRELVQPTTLFFGSVAFSIIAGMFLAVWLNRRAL